MLPKFPQFKKLELSDKADIEAITSKFPPYSDFNFVSMYSWDINGEMRISDHNGNLVVRFTDYITGKPFYSFLGENNVSDTIVALCILSRNEGIDVKFKLLSDHSVQEIKSCDLDSLKIEEDCDNHDYVYDMKKLFESMGQTYRTQRNQSSKFLRSTSNHEVKFISDVSSVKEDILKLCKIWEFNKENKGLQARFENESTAIKRVLEVNDNIRATCVYIDGHLVAFCINELLMNSPYVITHFGKADVSLPGVYSFLIHQNCKHLLVEGKQFCNSEQDLGIEQLRLSKLALRPSGYLKKYIVREFVS